MISDVSDRFLGYLTVFKRSQGCYVFFGRFCTLLDDSGSSSGVSDRSRTTWTPIGSILTLAGVLGRFQVVLTALGRCRLFSSVPDRSRTFFTLFRTFLNVFGCFWQLSGIFVRSRAFLTAFGGFWQFSGIPDWFLEFSITPGRFRLFWDVPDYSWTFFTFFSDVSDYFLIVLNVFDRSRATLTALGGFWQFPSVPVCSRVF